MKYILSSVGLIFSLLCVAQAELTPEEQAFQDSINQLNAANAATAEAQEAYNRGIAFFKKNKMNEAVKEFSKAIAGDSKFEAAYLNLVALILEGEAGIVEEMNSLGNSRKDNARYEVLKKERESLYKDCVPILRGLITATKNEEAMRTLMNIYGTLGENEGYKEMKALLGEN